MNLDRVVEYLHKYPGISAAELAKKTGYSRWYLSHEFKRKSGVSLRQYIEAVKIQRSIEHLLDDVNVTHSALDAGYNSLTTFSQTFKKHTSINARKYVDETKKAQKLINQAGFAERFYEYRRFKIKTNNCLSVKCNYPEGCRPQITFIGLFDDPLPKGNPVVGVALIGDRTHHIFHDVPPGRYYLLACDMQCRASLREMSLLRTNYRQRHDERINFTYNTHQQIELNLRLPRPDDPPITMNFASLLAGGIVKNRNLQ